MINYIIIIIILRCVDDKTVTKPSHQNWLKVSSDYIAELFIKSAE